MDIAFGFAVGAVAGAVAALLLGAVTNRAAYRNGFWDGVMWERTRNGRTFPEHDCNANRHHVCANSVCHGPGSESLYPSKPGPSWPGWVSLAAGARQREAEKSNAFAHHAEDCKMHQSGPCSPSCA